MNGLKKAETCLRGAIAQHGERPRPRFLVVQGVQQRFHGKNPPGGPGLGVCEGITTNARRIVMRALQRERDSFCDGRVHIVLLGLRHREAARRGPFGSAKNARATGDRRQRMTRHSREGLLKCEACVLRAAPTKMDRANRVPRVRAALACVQLAVSLEVELARKLLERAILTALRREHEAVQKVKADSLESTRFCPLCILRCTAGAQLIERRIERLARDEHGRRKPVRQRKAWAECQHALRGAEAILAPAHKRQTEVVMPVVRIEHDRLACSRHCRGCIAASM